MPKRDRLERCSMCHWWDFDQEMTDAARKQALGSKRDPERFGWCMLHPPAAVVINMAQIQQCRPSTAETDACASFEEFIAADDPGASDRIIERQGIDDDNGGGSDKLQ